MAPASDYAESGCKGTNKWAKNQKKSRLFLFFRTEVLSKPSFKGTNKWAKNQKNTEIFLFFRTKVLSKPSFKGTSSAISFGSTLPSLSPLNSCSCLRQVIPSSGKTPFHFVSLKNRNSCNSKWIRLWQAQQIRKISDFASPHSAPLGQRIRGWNCDLCFEGFL